MPSYTQYMHQMAVMDASDDDIESWITVKGNHIPIKKGQSKEDAVKSFIEKKSGSGEKKSEQKSQTVQSALGAKWTGVKLEGKYHQFHKKEDAENFIKEAKSHGSKESDIELVGFGEKKENGRYERPVHISEPLKDVVSETKAKMEKKEPRYFYKWTIESEKPHNLTNEQIQEKLNFYRFVRSNGRSDDNELLDKIHDLSDELERRKK